MWEAKPTASTANSVVEQCISFECVEKKRSNFIEWREKMWHAASRMKREEKKTCIREKGGGGRDIYAEALCAKFNCTSNRTPKLHYRYAHTLPGIYCLVPTNIYSLLERPLSSMQFSYALVASSNYTFYRFADTRRQHFRYDVHATLQTCYTHARTHTHHRFIHVKIDIATVPIMHFYMLCRLQYMAAIWFGRTAFSRFCGAKESHLQLMVCISIFTRSLALAGASNEICIANFQPRWTIFEMQSNLPSNFTFRINCSLMWLRTQQPAVRRHYTAHCFQLPRMNCENFFCCLVDFEFRVSVTRCTAKISCASIKPNNWHFGYWGKFFNFRIKCIFTFCALRAQMGTHNNWPQLDVYLVQYRLLTMSLFTSARHYYQSDFSSWKNHFENESP